jgi:hypothetical protein
MKTEGQQLLDLSKKKKKSAAARMVRAMSRKNHPTVYTPLYLLHYSANNLSLERHQWWFLDVLQIS